MRLPHRLQDHKVKSQGGAGAYCGGDLAAHIAAQLVIILKYNHNAQCTNNATWEY